MLVHRLRSWPNIEPTIAQCLVFAGPPSTTLAQHWSNIYIYIYIRIFESIVIDFFFVLKYAKYVQVHMNVLKILFVKRYFLVSMVSREKLAISAQANTLRRHILTSKVDPRTERVKYP